MNIKELEKEINDRHYKNDPVILGILALLKQQEKEIKRLQKVTYFMSVVMD